MAAARFWLVHAKLFWGEKNNDWESSLETTDKGGAHSRRAVASVSIGRADEGCEALLRREMQNRKISRRKGSLVRAFAADGSAVARLLGQHDDGVRGPLVDLQDPRPGLVELLLDPAPVLRESCELLPSRVVRPRVSDDARLRPNHRLALGLRAEDSKVPGDDHVALLSRLLDPPLVPMLRDLHLRMDL